MEKIDIEDLHDFLVAGGKVFHYIACLDESPPWIAALADIAEQHLIGWPTILPPHVREEQVGEAQMALVRAKVLGAPA